MGETWEELYRRLGGLDESSHAALTPLYNLFEQPERYDELFRHLQTVLDDEARQRNMIEQGRAHVSSRKRSRCWAGGGSMSLLLSALNHVEQVARNSIMQRRTFVWLVRPTHSGPSMAHWPRNLRCGVTTVFNAHGREGGTETGFEMR